MIGVAPPPPAPPPPKDAQAEPDARTWIGRRIQDWQGKQDPRYKHLPTMTEVTVREGINNPLTESGAWLLGAEDEGMVPVYKNMLGDRFLGTEKDANGYDLIRYKDADGQEAKAYVNRPGFDVPDAVRGIYGIAPYVGAGRLVHAGVKAAPLGVRALAQSVGQGTTAVAQDLSANIAGVSDFDMEKTLIKSGTAAAGGVAGEVIGAAGSALWRKLVTEPSLYNAKTGQFTAKGAELLRGQGIDPGDLSKALREQFTTEMARTGSAQNAARAVVSHEFGIPKTRGELAGDMPTLLREQHIRGGNYGEQGAALMQSFDRGQQEAIRNAMTGEIASTMGGAPRPGIAQRLAPNRSPADYGKAEMGDIVRSNSQRALDAAKAAEKKAWDDVPTMRATVDALPILKDKLNAAIGEFPILKGGKAEAMARELDSFIQSRAPEKAADWMAANPVGNVDQFRKRITRLHLTTEDPTDKAATGMMLNAYNDWIREAAERGLLNGGTAEDAAKLVVARGLTRQIHEIFDGVSGTAGARILGQVLKDTKNDSAEGVINALFVGPTSQLKNGSFSALDHLKRAYQTYLPADQAKAAWDDIRLAYFLRLVQGKGEMPGGAAANTANAGALGVQAIQSNLRQALTTQESITRLLYTPKEVDMLRRFIKATDGIEKKNPNRPWSGIAAGGIIRDMANSLITAFGFNSVMVKAGINLFGGQIVKKAVGPAKAAAATNSRLPAKPLPAFSGYGGGVAARSQD